MTVVQVGQHEIPVISVPAAEISVLGEFRVTRNGAIILLVEGLNGPLYRETLAHEIVHAWMYFTGLDNVFKKWQIELICDAFAPYIVQMAHEN